MEEAIATTAVHKTRFSDPLGQEEVLHGEGTMCVLESLCLACTYFLAITHQKIVLGTNFGSFRGRLTLYFEGGDDEASLLSCDFVLTACLMHHVNKKNGMRQFMPGF